MWWRILAVFNTKQEILVKKSDYFYLCMEGSVEFEENKNKCNTNINHKADL